MNAIQVIEPDITKARASQPIEETVRRAQGGDSEAFESLYREHYRRIYVLCLRMAGDEDRAEELTQEAFVRAWKNLRSFRGQSRFSNFGGGITLHRPNGDI